MIQSRNPDVCLLVLRISISAVETSWFMSFHLSPKWTFLKLLSCKKYIRTLLLLGFIYAVWSLKTRCYEVPFRLWKLTFILDVHEESSQKKNEFTCIRWNSSPCLWVATSASFKEMLSSFIFLDVASSLLPICHRIEPFHEIECL